jgi:hypothetical protein
MGGGGQGGMDDWGILNFGIWSLGFVWNLVLVIWVLHIFIQ